jgi:polyphosphate kinase 2 (PPK2 family)
VIVKVHLQISKAEQKKRFEERIADPAKRWKFRAGDLDDRARWHLYHEAYEEALTETSTAFAPWYVVPADHESVRNVAVARLLVDALERLDLRYPPGDPGIAAIKID